MKLADIARDIETAGHDFAGTLQRHLPTLLAAAQDPIVQALETAVLGPEVRAALAALITTLGAVEQQHQPPPAVSAPDGVVSVTGT